jgi:type VI secretion system protein VasG
LASSTPSCSRQAEGAVTFCKLRGNPHVELAHWLFQIINLPDSDVHRILRHFEIDSSRLVRDLQPCWSGCRGERR